MVNDAYERLLANDKIWFPNGQPIGAAHDDIIIQQPIELSQEANESTAAYIIRTVTKSDGSVFVEYASTDDRVTD